MTDSADTEYISIDRRALLQAVATGRVYRSAGGCDMQRARTGQNTRVDRRLRELISRGWVELSPDQRLYRLTSKGHAVKEGQR